MLRDDDARIDAAVQRCACAELAVCCRYFDPVSVGNIAGRGSFGMELDQRVGKKAPQARDITILAVAVGCGLGAGQGERKVSRDAVGRRFAEFRQGRLAVVEQLLGVDFDLPGGCCKARPLAIGIFAVARLQRDTNTFGVSA